MSLRQVQALWMKYLTPEQTPTYGTYEDRVPEYRLIGAALKVAGLVDDDLIVDVGAGCCDLDHWLRTGMGWRGRYLPVDGAVQGIDLNAGWLPDVPADWYVSTETVEHVYEADRLIAAMQGLASKGVVISTPNADSHDVRLTDPTHVRPVYPGEMLSWGFRVTPVNLNPGRGEGDTMICVWKP